MDAFRGNFWWKVLAKTDLVVCVPSPVGKGLPEERGRLTGEGCLELPPEECKKGFRHLFFSSEAAPKQGRHMI